MLVQDFPLIKEKYERYNIFKLMTKKRAENNESVQLLNPFTELEELNLLTEYLNI